MPTTVAAGPLAGLPGWFIALFITCAVGALLIAGFRAVAAARRFSVYRRAGLEDIYADQIAA